MRNFSRTIRAALVASLALTAPSPAQTLPGPDVHPLKQLWRDANGIAEDAELIRLRMEYCRPPNRPTKADPQAEIDALRQRLQTLRREQVRLKKTFDDSFAQGELGAGTRAAYPKLDGMEADHAKYWSTSNTLLTAAQNAIDAKQKTLNRAPERDCSRTPSRTEDIIVGNPPPVEPPPPPPPPRLPVDPLKGLTRPPIRGVKFPQLENHYCSQAQKDAALALFAPEIAKVNANVADIDAYIASLKTRRGELKARGVEQHWLDSMDYEIRNAETEKADRLTNIQTLETTRRLVESTPIVDCSKEGKEIGSLRSDGTGVAVSPTLFAGRLTTPRFRFIGKEHTITLEQTFEIEDLNDEGSVTGVAADFTAKLGFTAGISGGHKGTADSIHFGLVTYDANFSGAASGIDPLGERLLLPGTGQTGAPFQYGVSLGAGVPLGTPGGFNVVDRLRYTYETDSHSFYGKYARTWFCNDGAVTGYGGAGYSRIYQGQMLTGRLPGYGTDFAYESEIDIDVLRLIAGLFVDYPVKSVPGVSLGANATGFLNFADANGTDRFDLSGFTSQSIDVGKNETTFGANAGISIDWEWAKGAKIGAGFNYTYDETAPVVIRDGNTPSRLEFEANDMVIGTLRSSFSF